MKSRKIYTALFICLIALLSGCSKEKSACGDEGNINQLQTMFKKNLDNPDKLNVKIISTQKNESEENKDLKDKSCKGTAEIGINEEILKKFLAYNETLNKELGVKFQDLNLKPYQFHFTFQLLKNEMTNNDTISAKWEALKDKIDYTPINLYEKIDNNLTRIPFAKINQEVQKWLQADQRIAKDVKTYMNTKESLKFKYCSKVMDMEKDIPDLNVFCFYENEGGELITVTSIPQPLAKIAKSTSDNPILSLFAGNLAGIGQNLPMKMTKLKDDELKNYFESDLKVEFSEAKSDLY